MRQPARIVAPNHPIDTGHRHRKHKRDKADPRDFGRMAQRAHYRRQRGLDHRQFAR